MDKFDFSKSDEKIQKLLSQYKQYLDLSEKIEILEKSENKNLEKNIKISKLKFKQKKIWDDMKFDNPYIWIKYKEEAYKNSKNKIENIWDFIKHCTENPAHICFQRFDFLDDFLKKNYSFDLNSLEKSEKINNFLKNNIIQEISKNKDFIKNWLKFEYFEENWETKKWENYKKQD